jgi:endonuclease/exonuclease/phosphatase family metal-dependent hydrolase
LIDQGFFFLSETPDIASKGWDANLNRICMWGKFKDKKNKKTFFVFNTHFDHIGVIARENSAALVTEKIKLLAGKYPVFCLGDFNASSAETKFYEHMTTFLKDSKTESIQISGSTGTFNGWDNITTNFPSEVLIDYIFVRKVKVKKYQVITDTTVKKTYPSDHLPVVITCKIK